MFEMTFSVPAKFGTDISSHCLDIVFYLFSKSWPSDLLYACLVVVIVVQNLVGTVRDRQE